MTGLSYCAGQLRRLDHDRFLCLLLAPAAAREALFALYAFNLEVACIRELVSEPLLGRIRLQWWHEAVDGIYAGRPAPHPVVGPLAEAVRGFGLSREHFERLLEARAFDLDDDAPADLDALIDYAEGTSASLSLLSLEVLGVDDVASRRAARHVGIAWALSGLLRAIPFHSSMRRVYLPATLIRDAGMDASDLFANRPGRGLSRVVEEVAGSARSHLDASRLLRRETDTRALAALLPAILVETYLGKLGSAGFDPYDRRLATAGAGNILRLLFNRARGRY